jgi:hypothetical protein
MIGENHKRIRIPLSSVFQNQNQHFEYLVNGKPKLKNEICKFSGTISVDILNKARGITEQSLVFASNEFKESKN